MTAKTPEKKPWFLMIFVCKHQLTRFSAAKGPSSIHMVNFNMWPENAGRQSTSEHQREVPVLSASRRPSALKGAEPPATVLQTSECLGVFVWKLRGSNLACAQWAQICWRNRQGIRTGVTLINQLVASFQGTKTWALSISTYQQENGHGHDAFHVRHATGPLSQSGKTNAGRRGGTRPNNRTQHSRTAHQPSSPNPKPQTQQPIAQQSNPTSPTSSNSPAAAQESVSSLAAGAGRRA